MKSKKSKAGDLRVWHIPQVPMKPFYVYVESPKEGKKVINILAEYDLFQFENKVKGDYSNASGLQVFEVNEEAKSLLDRNEWVEWVDENGFNIDEVEF